jgi:hypothetical protein
MAVRFLAKLMRLEPDDAYRQAIARTLPRLAARRAIEERGRMLGDFLLALEETRSLPHPD